jgi:uncharacterized repeat protein (TIGR03803 family)
MAAVESWALTFETVHTFPANGTEGTNPWATLTIGPDRALYGTTTEGGADGSGTAFKYATGGTFETLDSFQIGTTGRSSQAQLITIGDGFLYGATSLGTGTAGQPIGTVFKLDPAGGAGAITPVFPIPGGGPEPKIPMSLTSGETGVLHVLGSSPGGVWRVPLAGGSPTVIFSFTTSDMGNFPWRIMRASDNNLYGITTGIGFVGTAPGFRGTIFRIAPDGTGYTKLHDCAEETGVAPTGQLVEGEDGTLYGTMSSGGTHLDGVIYKITKDGNYTVLHQVNDNFPTGDLVLASDGKLYGTSTNGGQKLYGSIFRINTNGTGYQVIHHFTKTNGAYPKGGLVQADDGKLYGVTLEGGADDSGTIFRIDLGLPAPPVNRPPVAVIDQVPSTGAAQNIPVLANDFDPDEGDAVTVDIDQAPTQGTAVVQGDGSITYTPTAGHTGYDEFRYKITDPDGLSSKAFVIISNQPIGSVWQPGVYNGLLRLDPNLSGEGEIPRGQLVINVRTDGLFTGKLFMGKKRATVRGLFTDQNTAIATVKIPGQGKAIIFLFSGEGTSLSAVLFAREVWSGFVSPLANPHPTEKRSYTFALESGSESGMPVGYGFGIARANTKGIIAIAGKLGDGSPFACGTTFVDWNGTTAIPVLNEPIRQGICGGHFVATSPTEFAGEVRWIRPPANRDTKPYPLGFNGSATGTLMRYVPPARGALPVDFGSDNSGIVALAGPTFTPGAQGTITVEGTRYRLAGDLKSFTISRGTGLFSGKVKKDGKTVSFRGAVLQDNFFGYGHFTVDKQTGAAIFGAQP